jgi:hypothetical protein
VAQAVAYTLGISLDLVSVKPSNNLTAPNNANTGGSATSELCTYVCITINIPNRLILIISFHAASANHLSELVPHSSAPQLKSVFSTAT